MMLDVKQLMDILFAENCTRLYHLLPLSPQLWLPPSLPYYCPMFQIHKNHKTIFPTTRTSLIGRSIMKSLEHLALTTLGFSDTDYYCFVCYNSKQTRFSYTTIALRDENSFELIDMDMWATLQV